MEKRIGKTVAFTGHRPEQLHGTDGKVLRDLICREISRCIDEGCGTFYCGAARGADIICGECVAEIRDELKLRIRLVCVIPFANQSVGWEQEWKERYRQLLSRADENVLLQGVYSRGCYHRRNRYLVEHAERVIAIYNGCGKGGTAYTAGYAEKSGKERKRDHNHSSSQNGEECSSGDEKIKREKYSFFTTLS